MPESELDRELTFSRRHALVAIALAGLVEGAIRIEILLNARGQVASYKIAAGAQPTQIAKVLWALGPRAASLVPGTALPDDLDEQWPLAGRQTPLAGQSKALVAGRLSVYHWSDCPRGG